MMTRNEAVQKLATAGRLSIAHAEDLYDSFFPKPVVPQYVADWYEVNKDDFEVNLFQCIYEVSDYYTVDSKNEFWHWLMSKDIDALTTLVNMHQFGYEVEKEKRYRISMPKARNHKNHAQILCKEGDKTFWCGEWDRFKTKFTRKELESNGFGWVFDCEGVEVKEVE